MPARSIVSLPLSVHERESDLERWRPRRAPAFVPPERPALPHLAPGAFLGDPSHSRSALRRQDSVSTWAPSAAPSLNDQGDSEVLDRVG